MKSAMKNHQPPLDAEGPSSIRPFHLAPRVHPKAHAPLHAAATELA